jgi:hypothetical protein
MRKGERSRESCYVKRQELDGKGEKETGAEQEKGG